MALELHPFRGIRRSVPVQGALMDIPEPSRMSLTQTQTQSRAQGAQLFRTSPDVSIVVPTRNRADRLPALLQALVAQEVHGIPYEILIVDSASTDGTAAMVAAHAHPLIRYLYEAQPGASNARNAGVREAGAEVIAFLDDDLMPTRDWLRRVTETMDAHPEVDCVGGRIEPEWPDTPPAWLTPSNYAPLALQYGRGGRQPLNAANASGCLVAANFVCRRKVLHEVGGFSPAFLRDEDRELNLRLWRAGKVGLYADEIVAVAIVQPERLTKAYHRRWHAVTGANHARLRFKEIIARDGHLMEPVTRHRVFGTPAYVYKELAAETLKFVGALITRRGAETFAAECRIRYLVSYIRTRRREGVSGPHSFGSHSAQAQS
jgi:glycosyltransferase involved in cell wall biosynthesis